VAHNRFERRTNGAVAIIEEKYSTRVVLDIEGNQREVIDAKDRIVMRYDYDMLGSPIHQASMEAGERWTLNDVAGSPIHAWDSRSHALTMEYDALRRPTQRFVEGTDPVHSDPRTLGNLILYEKIVYGEDYAGGREAAAEQNLLTRAWKQFDSAGVVTNETCDFKGNLLRSSRRLVRDYKTAPDWDTFPEPEDRSEDWEEELFLSSTRYDALNRPIQLVAPHAGSETDVIRPGYNEANLLERLDVWLKHAGEPAELLTPDTADEHFVTNIDYNARGQRTLIQYGNDAETRYHYDPATFRLAHLYTRRGVSYREDCGIEPSRYPAPDKPPQDTPCGLQNLHYTYDPAGNITSIRDDAQQTIYFDGEVVRPDAEYKYDAIYRLIESHSREHIGQASIPHTTWNDRGRVNLAHPHDGSKMRNYFEFYEYDEAGNILKFDHKDHDINWIRTYEYDEVSLIETGKKSNRLSRTVVHPNGQQPISELYTYDPHGNMTSMPHLQQMEWDYRDQLQATSKQVVNNGGTPVVTYYAYDAAGQRVRKVTERYAAHGETPVRMKERIYLGGFEIYREYGGDGDRRELERETLHVMDDQQRIALVETKTIDDGVEVASPDSVIRFQLNNHLGSSSLELDEDARVISYEEYYPYGSTSYQAVSGVVEVSAKRYRYTGMERDEETGLNYHGARYYVTWLGRWIAADPIGIGDGVNVYRFVKNNPVRKVDPKGTNGCVPSLIDEILAEEHQSLMEEMEQGFPIEDAPVIAAQRRERPRSSRERRRQSGSSSPERSTRDDRTDITLDVAETVLDVVSMTDVPIVSQVADLANAGIAVYRGDYLGAGLGVVAMIPVIGSAATAARLARRGVRVAEAVSDVSGGVRRAERATEAASEVSRGSRRLEAEAPSRAQRSQGQTSPGGGGTGGPGSGSGATGGRRYEPPRIVSEETVPNRAQIIESTGRNRGVISRERRIDTEGRPTVEGGLPHTHIYETHSPGPGGPTNRSEIGHGPSTTADDIFDWLEGGRQVAPPRGRTRRSR
jgi:RHS repeat-associated protein